MRPIRHEKHAEESYPIQVDFSPRLTQALDGATVVSATVAAENGLTVSSITTPSNNVRFNIAGGLPGRLYAVAVVATLNTTAKIQQNIEIEVK